MLGCWGFQVGEQGDTGKHAGGKLVEILGSFIETGQQKKRYRRIQIKYPEKK
jgi:hypothetical protein